VDVYFCSPYMIHGEDGKITLYIYIMGRDVFIIIMYSTFYCFPLNFDFTFYLIIILCLFCLCLCFSHLVCLSSLVLVLSFYLAIRPFFLSSFPSFLVLTSVYVFIISVDVIVALVHTDTRARSRQDSVRGIGPSQRPLPDNTQHSQETDIHSCGGDSNPQS
jgi:hypothetical protein